MHGICGIRGLEYWDVLRGGAWGKESDQDEKKEVKRQQARKCKEEKEKEGAKGEGVTLGENASEKF